MSAPDQQTGSKQRNKHKRVKQKPVLEQVPQQPDSTSGQTADGNSKFARALGSTDYATREKGLQALCRWLLHKESISELDIMRLWKGLYFCFWHSDKVPVQTELAERLAGLLPQLTAPMARLYWGGLLATLRREWSSLDHHRLNKFLMLVRKFVAALFVRLEAAKWDPTAITNLTVDLPLCQAVVPVSDSRSLGLSYHLADVWLQELKGVAGKRAVPPASLLLLLEPFCLVLSSSREEPLINRVKDSVFDVLVEDLTAVAAAAAGGDTSDVSSWRYCSKLDALQLAEQLFQRGAAEGVRARNREALYSTSKLLERTAGKRRKLGAAAAQSGENGQAVQDKREHKKKKKFHVPAEIEAQQQQQQQAADDMQVDAAASAKKKKRKHTHDHQQQQPEALQQAPAAPTPIQQRVHARVAQQQQQLGAADASKSAAGAADLAALQTPSEKSKTKKKKHSAGAVNGIAGAAISSQATAAAATPAAAAATPAAAAATPAANGGGASSSKKGVVIDLNRNVYFAHGAPVPAPEIRTPPRAKPKGPALKLGSSGLGKRTGTASVPAKPTASRLAQGAADGHAVAGSRKAVTPNSVPRVKAATFF